jgi:hypothetical protein
MIIRGTVIRIIQWLPLGSSPLDQIRQRGTIAANVLSFISCIEPRAITCSILLKVGSEEETEHAIGALCGYALLVKREDICFEMHRLVHFATTYGQGSMA